MARAFRLASAARSTTTQLRAPANGQIQPGATGPEQDQPLTTPVLVRGCFVRWWQVLGSNQRRLSRRFYRPTGEASSPALAARHERTWARTGHDHGCRWLTLKCQPVGSAW